MLATTTSTRSSTQRSARERLLDAADELFYEEGVHVVGIDRVIERAGVAKATLYTTFGSKEELVRAYLERRHEARQARIREAIGRSDVPREQLLAVFDVLGEVIAQPGFRGCAFVNASAESRPGGAVGDVSHEARTWTRSLLTTLSAEAGADDPAALAGQLVLLYDGALAGARMDDDTTTAQRARGMAATLIDAATSSRRG